MQILIATESVFVSVFVNVLNQTCRKIVLLKSMSDAIKPASSIGLKYNIIAIEHFNNNILLKVTLKLLFMEKS
jgi:hypothetical protein